jgi:nitrogen fixation NifU-like protein
MSASLYNEALVARAREAFGKGRLNPASVSVTLDNPLCGDRVTIDLRLEDGTLVAIGHETRGCLLCEAAASTIARHFPGKDRQAIKDGVAAISRLMQDGTIPPAPWSALEVFAPVHGARSRRNCVLLPFRALEQALNQS